MNRNDPTAIPEARPYADVFQPRPPRPSLSKQVIERLAHCPTRTLPSLVLMACQLHVSPRTLKRHLRQQDTSYRRLIDERRSAACGHLLQQRTIPLDTVAELLGYSSTANFSRAYQRWTGMTPGAHRRRLRGDHL